MKKGFLFSCIAILLSLNSCQPLLQQQTVNATPTLTSWPSTLTPKVSFSPTHSPTNTFSSTDTATPAPTSFLSSTDVFPVEPYADVRFQDLSNVNGNLDPSLIETLWFNESTKWPIQYADIANNILELGMNPGLGVRNLHKQGITGKGVNVAIIDQNMVLDHPEFQGKIVKYFDVGTKQPNNLGSMHGPAVTSLLVGENIGTAPGANVFYAAAPSWTGDAQYYADALNWIVDENEKLPEGNKIRVVSVSAAPSGPGSPFTMHNDAWDVAFGRAADAGILVLDCTMNRGITAPCFYDLNDPDSVGKCTPGYPGMNTPVFPDHIYIPTSFRTTAEEYNQGTFSYQYTGRGGLSWTVPYLSGVLALGWQTRPNLSNSQIVDILFSSAYKTNDGLLIIDPVAFIEIIRAADDQ